MAPGASYQIHDSFLAAAAQGIKNIESSGGDYNALGKVITYQSGPNKGKQDQAYGAYQVMGANVGDWTQKYYGSRLTPQEFVKNKQAQDMVFEGEFSRLSRKYGPEGAARAWYAGEGGKNNSTLMDANRKLTVAQYGHALTAHLNKIAFAPPGMSPAEAATKFAGQKIMDSDGNVYEPVKKGQ